MSIVYYKNHIIKNFLTKQKSQTQFKGYLTEKHYENLCSFIFRTNLGISILNRRNILKNLYSKINAFKSWNNATLKIFNHLI